MSDKRHSPPADSTQTGTIPVSAPEASKTSIAALFDLREKVERLNQRTVTPQHLLVGLKHRTGNVPYENVIPFYDRGDQGVLKELLDAKRFSTNAKEYQSKGELDQASASARKALNIHESSLGFDHHDTLSSLIDLAFIELDQGKHTEAASLAGMALERRKDKLGADHYEVANALQDLAYIALDSGNAGKAINYLSQSLIIRENFFGRNHPSTADSLELIANAKGESGDLAGAQAYLQQALESREEVLKISGEEVSEQVEIDVARTLCQLAAMLMGRAEYVAAYTLAYRALKIREQRCPANDPDIADSLLLVAVLMGLQSAASLSRPLAERALAIYEVNYGPDHSDTNQARLYLEGLEQARTSHEFVPNDGDNLLGFPKELFPPQDKVPTHEQVKAAVKAALNRFEISDAEKSAVITEIYNERVKTAIPPKVDEIIVPPLPTKAPAFWKDRPSRKSMNPADFVFENYKNWIGKGLTRALIGDLDPLLAKALQVHIHRHGPLPFDLPTRSEVLDQKAAKFDAETIREVGSIAAAQATRRRREIVLKV